MSMQYEVPFYLTVNALRITESQRTILMEILKDFQRIGGERVIISDLSLLRPIINMGLKVTVSSCANIRNQYSVQLLKDAGCERIIFPRDLTLEEIVDIKSAVSDMEYEVFLMNSGCKFSDGNCLGLHGSENGALCDYCRKANPIFYRTDSDRLSEQEQTYLEEQNYIYNRLFRHACGQCAIFQLKEYIDSVKIVGRAAEEEKILEDIRNTKKNIMTAEFCRSNEEYLTKMIRPDNGAICRDYTNCYYRTDMINSRNPEEKDLELKYKDFFIKEDIEHKKNDIEYLGINLSGTNKEIEFKLYYKEQYSRKEPHPIIEKLEKREMIRTLTQIADTKNGKSRRYDIGLGNRTKDNMELLLKEISELAPYCIDYQDEIRFLSKMKVCSDPLYALAALYFWGFIEKKGSIEAMKMHYLTRICENPDKLGKHITFDDAYYLDYLEKSQITQFHELLPIVKSAASGKDGILWMIGADYFKDGNHKYKIYFKTPTDTYIRKLKEKLYDSDGQCRQLSILLNRLEIWLYRHPELKIEGLAVCLDVKGCWSLNFYYQWTE